MYFHRKPISKMSNRGRLRKEIGRIHFEILCQRRGKVCEICGRTGQVGRFHILEVSTHPRLEFVDSNIILAHWMEECQAHYLWHHFGSHDPRNKRTEQRIIELRGADWEENLLEQEKHIGRMDGIYLLALRDTMQKELETLKTI